jgi:hypothetical protein
METESNLHAHQKLECNSEGEKMKISKLFLAAIFMSLISLATPAFAGTVYTYQGNPMTNNSFGGSADLCSSGTSLCTLTGSFTVAEPLADNLSFAAITPESFSFTDGLQTSTTLTLSNIDDGFWVATNASGNIIEWYIQVGNGSLGTLFYGGSAAADFGYSAAPLYDLYNYGPTGTWTESTTDPSPTPEPSSLLLLSSGLIGLGLIKRKIFQS